MNPFEIKDCALLVRMSGLPPAINLRELRMRIAACSESVLYHHFCETLLRPTFDNPDYRNDFAVWAKLYLGDRVLAERLGILDPYAMGSIEELRGAVLEILEDRLSEITDVTSVSRGDEFYFLEATTVTFDTGDRIRHPRELAAAVRGMTNGSIYYHFLEARRRLDGKQDDFSFWLQEEPEKNRGLIEALGSIDFYFYSLAELRRQIVQAISAARGRG
ncbi:MAG: DUF5752 family protein [Deltaproteobacteria bacterium]